MSGNRRERLSSVSVERTVDCPFSLAVDEAAGVVQLLEGANNGGIRLPLRALGLPIGGALARQVGARVERRRDSEEAGRLHDEIGFDWNAGSRLLPDFHGVLRFRIEALQTRAILLGEYRPPLGALGGLFDRILGRRLARASLRDLVDRLANFLESRWAAERGPVV